LQESFTLRLTVLAASRSAQPRRVVTHAACADVALTWHEWQERAWSSPESSFSAGELDEAATDAALAELLPPGAALLPALGLSPGFASRRGAWGVRALPPRATLGRLPLLRALPVPPGAPPADCWLLAGLGARGLVYHALLAEALATALLARDASLLPPETAQ
jgi:hypothetical protein